MREFTFRYETEVRFGIPVERHDFVLRCMPPSTLRQRVRCNVELDPDVPFDVQRDSFGNPLVVGRIEGPHELFRYEVSGTAFIDRDARDAADPHPLYRRPSPFALPSEEMVGFLASVVADAADVSVRRGRGVSPSPSDTCRLLMDKVADALEYAPGSTTVQTTAAQAFAQRKGVCQDFTHILVALIRLSGVPARYVSGLTLGEGATHAWAEAWLDGRWVGFDATRRCLADDSYLTLATGRDWGDCPVERATFQGFTTQEQRVFAQMREV